MAQLPLGKSPDATLASAAKPGKRSTLGPFPGVASFLRGDARGSLRLPQRFDLNPQQYLSKSAETPKGGHGGGFERNEPLYIAVGLAGSN